MTLLTIPNGSFEVPDGTMPTLVSGGVEPFELVDDTFLDLSIITRGGFSGVVRWTVDAADFADVSNASANEVRDAINNAGIFGLEADASAGRVTVKAAFNGSTLQVIGGQPQTALLFPTDPVTGEIHFGAGQAWSITATSAFLEFAGFGASPELAAESFEVGWGEQDVIITAFFTEPFEDGWGGLTPGGSLESGLFLPGPVLFESFEESWDVMLVQSIDTAVTGQFNPGPKDEEDFEDDWTITSVTEPTAFTPGLFNDGADSFDGFENFVPYTHVVEVVSAVAGTYSIEISGVPYEYQATGGDTLATIGQGLVDDINAGSQMGAAGVNPFSLTPTPLTTVIPTVVVHGPTAGSLKVVLAPNHPIYVDQWVGQDSFQEL